MRKHIIPCLVIIVISTLLCTFTTLYFLQRVPIQSDAGYISTIATLIGVMVTFAIGYQILSALDVKREIEVSQRRLDRTQRRNELESKRKAEQIKTLEESLRTEVDTAVKRLEISTEVRTCYSLGLQGITMESYESALFNLLEAYLHRMDYIPFEKDEKNIATYNVLEGENITTFHTPDFHTIMSGVSKLLFTLLNDDDQLKIVDRLKLHSFFKYVEAHTHKSIVEKHIQDFSNLIDLIIKLRDTPKEPKNSANIKDLKGQIIQLFHKVSGSTTKNTKVKANTVEEPLFELAVTS